jgi:acylphosphatase
MKKAKPAAKKAVKTTAATKSHGKSRVHIFVYGDVQGIFFRANAVKAAVRLGVTGWVRNRADGSVEIVAEGDKTALQTLCEWCNYGAPGATVDKVESEWKKFTGEFDTFIAMESF